MASAKQIHVGSVPIGGGAPVAVQTMTKTETANIAATIDQIHKVAEAGADIVRLAVPYATEALRSLGVPPVARDARDRGARRHSPSRGGAGRLVRGIASGSGVTPAAAGRAGGGMTQLSSHVV